MLNLIHSRGLTFIEGRLYGRVEHPPQLEYQACSRSPTTRSLDILKYTSIHLDHIDNTFSINNSVILKGLYKSPYYHYFTTTTKIQYKVIPKNLFFFNTIALPQIQDSTKTRMLTIKEFQD